MMMGEETEHAASIPVVVMSTPAMIVALTCRGSKLECFHRNLLYKKNLWQITKISTTKWLSRIANSRNLYWKRLKGGGEGAGVLRREKHLSIRTISSLQYEHTPERI